jgi:hypothetical protein
MSLLSNAKIPRIGRSLPGQAQQTPLDRNLVRRLERLGYAVTLQRPVLAQQVQSTLSRHLNP